MKKQRAFFFRPFGDSEWREVDHSQNQAETREGNGARYVWARYLFRNGDKTLHVFKTIPWAKIKDGVEQKRHFLGWPDGHAQVFNSLCFFAPSILQDELGIDPKTEQPVGNDSGPIGDLSGKFNGVGTTGALYGRP